MKNSDPKGHAPNPEEQDPPAPPTPPAPPPGPEDRPQGLLTKAEIAALFGVTRRTVTNWLARGCPSEEGPGGRRLFNEPAVRAWHQARAREDDEEPVPLRPGDPAARATLAKAELVRKLTQAKREEMELAAERGLKDLELAEKIRGASTHDDMLAISREVCALIGSGGLSPTRGRAIQGLLGEMRRSLKEHLGSGEGEEPEQLMLLSEEGARLVEDFEAIVSDERRARALQHMARERSLDEEENPNVDLAALTPEEAEELGLDLDDFRDAGDPGDGEGAA